MSQETLWERARHTFERIYEEGEKAAERVGESLEDLGEVARARVEKVRLERQLFKRFAELGSAVYELRNAQSQLEDTARRDTRTILEDPDVRKLLEQIDDIERGIGKAERRIREG